MKKVLFVIGNAEIGGTRTSLFNLLNHFSKEKDMEVYLYMISHCGSLMDRIPKNVVVISEDWQVNASLPGQSNKSIFQISYHLIVKLKKTFLGFNKTYEFIFKYASKRLFKKYGEFDAAFGYQEGICNYFSEFVKAKKHYTWIHNDLEAWYTPDEFEYSSYENSNNILFVADIALNKFVESFPEFKSKCKVIKNTINCDDIREKSKDQNINIREENKRIFLSVGRIAKQKAFDRIIPIAIKMKEDNFKFKWYVLGDGPEKNYINDLINQNNLKNEVILVGSTDNPYVYMVNSDLLVVTSFYESQPMVILESLTLGLPVVTTRYSSSEEILKDKPYGIICENSVDSLIASLLSISDENIHSMRVAASEYQYDNQAIINSIRGLIV